MPITPRFAVAADAPLLPVPVGADARRRRCPSVRMPVAAGASSCGCLVVAVLRRRECPGSPLVPGCRDRSVAARAVVADARERVGCSAAAEVAGELAQRIDGGANSVAQAEWSEPAALAEHRGAQGALVDREALGQPQLAEDDRAAAGADREREARAVGREVGVEPGEAIAAAGG